MTERDAELESSKAEEGKRREWKEKQHYNLFSEELVGQETYD